jgi:hypothetical protein
MSPSLSSQWLEGQGSAPVSISGDRYTIWSKCVMRFAVTGVFFLGKRAQSRCRFCWNASCR